MRILYLLPHCSTGGMPQYVVRQVQDFLEGNEIFVLEVDFYGEQYVVQRNRLQAMCTFDSLYGNQALLQSKIEQINPEVIHCQELPEKFLDQPNLEYLYKQDRTWFVVVTSHSSLTYGQSFDRYPDKLVAVNNWQKNLFLTQLPTVPCDIWEFPIESKEVTPEQKIQKKLELGMDINRKHILNVGLFTPGKNQGELFEIARVNPQNTYHFVGNQAPNFENYWGPLMQNKPANCVVWGEKDDVDLFYQACDEFYFPSTFELNPICIKEALSYGLPCKIRKFPTYGNDYDNNPLVTYI